MKGKLFTLEKPPFLAVGLFFIGLAFRYFEDFRKTLPPTADYYHAQTLFILFLAIGMLSLGLYFGLLMAERNITRNVEKGNRDQ